MSYTNFQVGEKFPLPIAAAADGGLFQYDANGAMFILQLGRTDVIATEAFRTGKMELALFEEDGVAFFLYQIDGIFNQGWGDCPYAAQLVKEDIQPDFTKKQDPSLHLYLVDTRLQLLLAMRRIDLSEQFQAKLIEITKKQLAQPREKTAYIEAVQKMWQKYSAAQMRAKAVAVQQVAFDIPKAPPSATAAKPELH